MQDSNQTCWKRCSTCKKPINFQEKYYLCSVSTCKHPRKGFHFCSVGCWDAHLGFANHRESWAEEAIAPKYPESELAQTSEIRTPTRKIIEDHKPTNSPNIVDPKSIKTDTLVVVSKVKSLIQEQSGFNTSQCFIDGLTQLIVRESLQSIEKAKQAGRKTVMGRDL